MKNKSLFLLMTCLSFPVMAGLNDGILAYNYGQYPSALMEFGYLQEEGDPIATYYMGKMYQSGQGVGMDKAQALAYFKAADAAYYFPASTEVGKVLIENNDIDQGIVYLKKATLSGDAEAAFLLGELYSDEQNPFFNLNQAYGYYLIAALGGHMKGQYQLANMYLNGRGVPQDYRNAFTWLNRSAKQGYVLAQVELADLFLTNKQYENRGNAYAWYSIIAAYNTDEVGQKAQAKRDELETRLKNKELAAKQESLRKWKPVTAEKSVPKEEKNQTKIPLIQGLNDVNSLQETFMSLGFIPRNPGRFGLTNAQIDKAIGDQTADALIPVIESAFRAGKKDAYGYLGDLFKTRFGNVPEAFLWYKKGAEAGDAYAQYQMAKMLCEGKGVTADVAGCYSWMLRVQQDQHPILNMLAQNALSAIHNQMSEEDLKQALKQMSDEDKPKKKDTGNLFDFF